MGQILQNLVEFNAQNRPHSLLTGLADGDPHPQYVLASALTESVQDAIGGALVATPSVSWFYDDANNAFQAAVIPGGVNHNALSNLTTGDPHTQYALADKSRPAVWVAAGDLAGRSLADLGTRAHSVLSGLAADDHTQYGLLAGRAGGQTLIGGSGASENLLLKPTSNATLGYVGVPYAPRATANYGLVSLGSAPFDGVTAGFYVGSASGTHLAINAATGYTGNFFDAQLAGVSRFKLTKDGTLWAIQADQTSFGLQIQNRTFNSGAAGSNGFNLYQANNGAGVFYNNGVPVLVLGLNSNARFSSTASLPSASTIQLQLDGQFYAGHVGSASNDVTQDGCRVQPWTTKLANYRPYTYYAVSTDTLPTWQIDNSGFMRMSALSSVQVREVVRFEQSLPTNTDASFTGRLRCFVADFGSLTGREFLRADANGTSVAVTLFGSASVNGAFSATTTSGATVFAAVSDTGLPYSAILTGATSNAISTIFSVDLRTSGAGAAGFGSRFRWMGKSSTTIQTSMLDEEITWVVATAGATTARARWLIYDTAAREALRIEASGAAPMIGFLGAAAVVRQTLAAAAVDAATTQTLANSLRTALVNLGLGA